VVTVKNIELVDQLISSIQEHLTPDRLKSEYKEQNKSNRMFGHCYVATETLYHLLRNDQIRVSDFPIKLADKYHPYHAKDENEITHWWLEDDMGNRLDVTIDQFLSVDRHPPYDGGRKGWFLTKNASKRFTGIDQKVLDDQ